MAFDLWTHQFCLACDKQTDGAVYCSESCRLADFEKTSSSPSSSVSSPGLASPSSYPWTTTSTSTRQSAAKFYLSPAYDFSNPQPYGSTPVTTSFATLQRPHASSLSSGQRGLTPSTSHSSLCSMQSTSSVESTAALSDKARNELRAYAVSFEQVRLQRRRSY